VCGIFYFPLQHSPKKTRDFVIGIKKVSSYIARHPFHRIVKPYYDLQFTIYRLTDLFHRALSWLHWKASSQQLMHRLFVNKHPPLSIAMYSLYIWINWSNIEWTDIPKVPHSSTWFKLGFS